VEGGHTAIKKVSLNRVTLARPDLKRSLSGLLKVSGMVDGIFYSSIHFASK